MATQSIPGHHNSTPVRPTPIKGYWLSQNFSGPHQSVKIDKMKTLTHFLMEENKDYQHANVDLMLFVEHTWDLSQSDGEKILGLDISLDPASLIAYKSAPHETKLHKPFASFADQLLQAAFDTMKPIDETPVDDSVIPSSPSSTETSISDTVSSSGSLEPGPANAVQGVVANIFWDGNGSKALKQHGRSRKPDMIILCSPLSDNEGPKWTIVKHIIEFKNESKEKLAPSPRDADSRRPAKGRRAQSMTNVPKVAEPSSSWTAPTTSKATTKKRTRDAAKDTLGGGQSKEKSKKPRTDGLLSERHFQLAGYASEALAATSRNWVVGVVIDVCNITVCYFDRFLIARASSFNFDSEPQKLALVLYCMHRCNLRQAGFDPHLRPWSSLSPPGTFTEDTEDEPTQPVERLEDSFLEYPLDQESKRLLESIIFPCELSQIVPQACDIDPVSSQEPNLSPNAEDMASDPATTMPNSGSDGVLSMRIVKVIRTPDADLICRGTVVYEVKIQLPGGGETEDAYAYKLSWPLKKRVSEVEFIRRLKELLPAEGRKHLPEVFFSRTAYPQDLSLPWLHFGLPLNETNYQDRVQRGIGFKLYKALWEAGSIDKFRKVWLDCVEVHHLAFTRGKVLHRDISENNLMVTLDVDGSVIGLLNDWDMAKLVGNIDDALTVGKHRTASSPFVAFDLLSNSASPHFFRHDLESFFWILVWAALHYDLTSRTRDSEVHPLLQQAVESSTGNASWKCSVFSPFSTFITDLAAAAKEELKEMCSENGWIGLIREFCYTCRADWDREVRTKSLARGTTEGWDTYGGRFTFEKFMREIGQEPRAWDPAVQLSDE